MILLELDFYKEQREMKFKELMDKLWLYKGKKENKLQINKRKK